MRGLNIPTGTGHIEIPANRKVRKQTGASLPVAHRQGVAPSGRWQNPDICHPVQGRYYPAYTFPGRMVRPCGVEGPLRHHERVYTQGMKFRHRPDRVVSGVGRYLLGGVRSDCRWRPTPWQPPAAACLMTGWWPCPRDHLLSAVDHRLAVIRLLVFLAGRPSSTASARSWALWPVAASLHSDSTSSRNLDLIPTV